VRVSLKNYDIIVVNTSAGKDSLAMLSIIAEQAEKEGVLDRVVAVHADLGRVEWAGTKELAQRQAAAHGVRFVVAERTINDLLDHVEAHGKWPSNNQRYCTSDHKRAPIQKAFTHMVNEWRSVGYDRTCYILNCMGMRADESPARAKKETFTEVGYGSNGKRQISDFLPIHHLTEADVWKRIHSQGLSTLVHRAYGLGMPRLSCCFCIFAPKAALVLAGKHNPELLDEYVRVEKKIGHTFRQNLSMAEVQKAVENCEAPVEVTDWKM